MVAREIRRDREKSRVLMNDLKNEDLPRCNDADEITNLCFTKIISDDRQAINFSIPCTILSSLETMQTK